MVYITTTAIPFCFLAFSVIPVPCLKILFIYHSSNITFVNSVGVVTFFLVLLISCYFKISM